jgi:hypothetical protein
MVNEPQGQPCGSFFFQAERLLMASFSTSVGFAVVDGDKQTVYLSGAALRTDNLEVGLAATNTNGVVYHRTDSGRRGTTWSMPSLYFHLNRGSYDGDILFEYVYTDVAYDVEDADDRVDLEELWSDQMSLATMQGEDDQVGRYRYLRVTLVANGVDDPVITTTAESQVITAGVEYSEPVMLSVETPQAQRTMKLWRKSTPTIALFYVTTPDGVGRFDIAGATIQLWIGKSIRKVDHDGAALVGPLAVTIDDASHGEASLALTQAQTTLESGDYIMQVQLTKGAQILRHTISVEVLGTYL